MRCGREGSEEGRENIELKRRGGGGGGGGERTVVEKYYFSDH